MRLRQAVAKGWRPKFPPATHPEHWGRGERTLTKTALMATKLSATPTYRQKARSHPNDPAEDKDDVSRPKRSKLAHDAPPSNGDVFPTPVAFPSASVTQAR